MILTGIIYGTPMAVQPLKAVATIVIANQLNADVVWAGGLVIACIMLLLTITGFLDFLAKFIHKSVIRGIQLGLGITLAQVAFKNYISISNGWLEWLLVIVGFSIVFIFLKNKRYPAALILLIIGISFALFFKSKLSFISLDLMSNSTVFKLNKFTLENLMQGFLLLALPQIPLSLGNSVLASKQLVNDLFPEKKITIKKIGFTYSFMNFISSIFGGIPVCHGSNGIIGQYTFGGRAGGSVIIQGIFFILIGLLFSNNLHVILNLFPKQILGILLLVESMALIALIQDLNHSKREFWIAITVGMISFGLPYGFLIGIIVGVILYKSNLKLTD
ncbi:MAG: putative sulfate/molybdate transporter [Crocinitomicaceae bacterium]|nr:putative sulfate/molybdate transporter [Crocinitomicaceae bacterium]